MIRVRLVIDDKTIMVQTIGDQQVPGTNGLVVSADLIERILVYPDIRRLALRYQERPAVAIIHDKVRAPAHALIQEALLHSHEGLRDGLLAEKVLYKMLPDPFFRSEWHVLLAQGVKDQLLTSDPAHGEIVTLKVEYVHAGR